MTLLSLHCRNSEALRCSVLQTGSVVTFMEACQSLHLNQLSTNQSSASKDWTHARKCYRDPCRLSFIQRACSQAIRSTTYDLSVAAGSKF